MAAANLIPTVQWSRLGEFIGEHLGLHFPSERTPDLLRGISSAAREAGSTDVSSYVDWLLTGKATAAQLRTLAGHLTVGETYFFREKKTFDALAEKVLPAIVQQRRRGDRRLRLWSAGCCTGEEAYSLSILLHQIIPDVGEWSVTILATDINDQFLKKAVAGIYSEWSFRDVPTGFREAYFRRTSDGRYALLPRYKRLVTFAQLNLVEDTYPSIVTDTNAMDVIFCRNVLMYFTTPQAQKVVSKLGRSLINDGWLILSPSDGSRSLSGEFTMVNFPGAILHQKQSSPSLEATPPILESPATLPTFEAPPAPAVAVTAPPPKPIIPPREAPIARHSERARALANEGKLHEALEACEEWVTAEKMNAAAHYLRAVILQELGNPTEARQSLQRAIYLQPTFILAHFAAGNLARETVHPHEAQRHFTNALKLLAACSPEDVLPEADGLTARRLTEIIESILTMEPQS